MRLSRLLQGLHIARGDGRYGEVVVGLARMEFHIIDDWGQAPLDNRGQRNILEILDDCHESRSTIIPGQLPVPGWHELIGDTAFVEAVCLAHHAHKIELNGESIRKILKSLTPSGHSGT